MLEQGLCYTGKNKPNKDNRGKSANLLHKIREKSDTGSVFFDIRYDPYSNAMKNLSNIDAR